MVRGRALTIGLNSVDPKHYGGWSGDLNACEADAEDMAGIAKGKKFKVATLMTKASVLLLSGCQDNQLSSDGNFNGLFKAQLLKVLKNGAFRGDYKKFHKGIVKRMPPDQTPNYFWVGAPNPKFESQRPFTV